MPCCAAGLATPAFAVGSFAPGEGPSGVPASGICSGVMPFVGDEGLPIGPPITPAGARIHCAAH